MAQNEMNPQVTQEFGPGDGFLTEGVDRRTLLKTAGALSALLAAGSCGLARRPTSQIEARGQTDARALPGQALYFATTMAMGEEVVGLLAECHEGRPTKIEGNPDHPGSLGATHGRHQASIFEVYDPDRLTDSRIAGKKTQREGALTLIEKVRQSYLGVGGQGLALVLPTVTSPTELRYLDKLRAQFPKALFVRDETINLDAVAQGTAGATGLKAIPRVDFETADIVLSLDSDFLGTEVDSVKNTRSFSARRNPGHVRGMNRLYQVEPAMSLTGAMADGHLALSPSQIENFALHLARALVRQKPAALASMPWIKTLELPALPAGRSEKFLAALAADLLSATGKSAVVCGAGQSPALHSLTAAMNGLLGNWGASVTYAQPRYRAHEIYQSTSRQAVLGLTEFMKQGSVKTLVLLGVDPVYSRGADFTQALAKVPEIICLSLRQNHTAKRAHHVIAQSHPYESWGDFESVDGVVSLGQPVLAPLASTVSELEWVMALAGQGWDGRKAVAETAGLGEIAFQKALQKGLLATAQINGANPRATSFALPAGFGKMRNGLELHVVADPSVHDGRFANNAWLQELPHPISRHTWGNALWVPSALARSLSLKDGDVVKAQFPGFEIEGPVHLAVGQADNTLTLTTGHGQTSIGRIGEGWGINATAYFGEGGLVTANLAKTGKQVAAASVQEHRSMEGRDPARSIDLRSFLKAPSKAGEPVQNHNESGPLTTAFPNPDPLRQWGMVIDLGRCTGCSACLVSCQAENNIPAVGRENVQKGREMHWIRIDRYVEGPEDDPALISQPVACAQCEAAPCEQVCPVNATAHSHEGLSDMAYNRCIGMRYCANNCPYKVRRFNFLDWHQEGPQSKPKGHQHLFDLFREPETTRAMQHNPEVTVRMRGVMEKCTYCVQRIQEAKAASASSGKPIADGQIQTACSQACPAGAISFGNLVDRESRVSRLKAGPRNYELLGELGIKPRTTYLTAVRNPNPELSGPREHYS